MVSFATFKTTHWKSKGMQEKESNQVFGTDRKFRPRGSLFGITRQSFVLPNTDPGDGIFYPHRTRM